MPDRLDEYRHKRDRTRTPEPVPTKGTAGRPDRAEQPIFVIQEHHARRLHWDLRLERDGVLVSWAVPKGLPTDPKHNHIAIQTEDHPMEYAGFEGEIPQGEYGGGTMAIWDHGTYEAEQWDDHEIKIVLQGERVDGRFVLIRTDDRNWLMHVMGGEKIQPVSIPGLFRPMLATPGELPGGADDDRYAYEMKWDGARAVTYVQHAQVRVMTRNDRDVTATYPELLDAARAVAGHDTVLDGEIVALDDGRPSFAALQQRMHVTDAHQVQRLARSVPVSYLVFDLLWLNGEDLTKKPYDERRARLESLGIDRPAIQVPPAFIGGGTAALQASRTAGLEGVVAKRRNARYEPGRRSRSWIKVKNIRSQEVVIGGWRPGAGQRAGSIGSLLVGIPSAGGLGYAGRVGTGFTQPMLDDLMSRLEPLERKSSPFDRPLASADARDAHWVRPELVGEVAYSEWTREGRLRQPSWRGLRPDKSPSEVVREP